MTRATRSLSAGVTLTWRSGSLGDELVPFDLGDAHAREASWLEASTQIDDAVDLRRLARGAPFPLERGILARSVHQHVDDSPAELHVLLPGDMVLALLHDRRAVGRHARGNLIGELRRRRSLFRRIREDAEAIEPGV